MKLPQVNFAKGEVSPSISCRVDLGLFLSALKTCRNFFVRPQGGLSNRQGTEYVYALDPASAANLIPFIRAEDDAYMLVLQEENARVFRDGAYVSLASSFTIIGIDYDTVEVSPGEFVSLFTVTTSAPHDFVAFDTATIADVVHTFVNNNVNGSRSVYDAPGPTFFRFEAGVFEVGGAYVSGGTATKALSLVTPYQSDELASLRYTQSADVLTLVHQGYFPSEIVRTSPTAFAFAAIADIDTGPFLNINDTATTMTSSAATGTVTLTASTSVFTANHIGALVILYLEDLSALAKWEVGATISISDQTLSNGKVYIAITAGTTGSIPPSHDEGSELDGATGVEWEYLHSLYGVARVTAQAGTTATATVLSYIPVISTDTTVKWAFGAWSEDQGYPGVVTYFGDRLAFARSLEQPQTQWASKTGDYHNFSKSSPIVDDDSITQTLNSRQTNAIVEMVPVDQLISLTANSSWASPKRGESWSPETIGFDPQSNTGAADLRAITAGEKIIHAERFGTRLRELSFGFDRDKFGGPELTVLARHLFKDANIVDMDYAEYPDGILWIVRSDGVLIGLTYLPEQEVIAFHRHDTNGYFERVCVIPEDGRDAVYFVVRRTNSAGATVRNLERLSARSNSALDAFYVDAGLTYDGRNTTSTTITASGASYDGGETVTLLASAPLFASTDIGDAIQFGSVHVIITGYTSATLVSGELQSPMGVDLQAVATETWTFARNTFSGLGHLNGLLVTGLADGNTIDPDDTTTDGIVSGSQLVLTYPAGVVHIGLGYVQEIETLTMNVPGGAQIRDNAKIVPKVSIVVEDTAGLQVGPDSSHLQDIASREFEFYTDPTTLQTGVQVGYTRTTWNLNSSVVIRQPHPKPANILAILPTLSIGSNG